MKKTLLFAFSIILLFSLTACTKEYTLTSVNVYDVLGTKLADISSGAPEARLTLSSGTPRDGTSVKFKYNGSYYTGIVKSGYVLWEEDPYIVKGTKHMYTIISKDKGSICLSHHCFVGEDAIHGDYYEIKQTFEP